MLLKNIVIVFSDLQGIVDRIAKPLSKSERFHEGHLELWHVGWVLDVAQVPDGSLVFFES